MGEGCGRWRRATPEVNEGRRALLGCLLASAMVVAVVPARAEVTLNIVNNFSQANTGTYFGSHIESQDVYIFFTGIGAGDVTYNGGAATAAAGTGIQLSSVAGGSFTLSNSINAGRVYALLGSSGTGPGLVSSTMPLTGPSPVTSPNPYAFIELSTTSLGTADQSMLNQVSFPTSLSSGTSRNAWTPTATAQSITGAFHTAFSGAPYAPAAGQAPGAGQPYNPYSPTSVVLSTSSGTINGYRIIGPSNTNNPAASPPPAAGTGYTNVPGFNNYLGWLQDNQPTQGWQIGYTAAGFPDSTYVGYLFVTGSNNNYGIEMSNFTFGGSIAATGTMSGGTAVSGTITIAPNNSQRSEYGVDDYTANWTDLAIFAANDPTGEVVTYSGDFALPTNPYDTASILYTMSAALGPGILGSDAYLNDHSSNTDYFFKNLEAGDLLSSYFANSTFGGSTQADFFDQYWYTMLSAGGVSGTETDAVLAGYLVSYDDHFSNLDVLMPSDSGTLTWELGVASDGIIPEPSSVALIGAALVMLGCRRRQIPAV